jgi:hypothetical protein
MFGKTSTPMPAPRPPPATQAPAPAPVQNTGWVVPTSNATPSMLAQQAPVQPPAPAMQVAPAPQPPPHKPHTMSTAKIVAIVAGALLASLFLCCVIGNLVPQ